LFLCGALALTACGGTDDETAPVTTPRPGASAPISGSAVDDSPTPTADGNEEPTCEGILPAETVAAFTDTGWTSRQDPFYVGNIEMSGGLQCVWGNPEVASDDVQVYGWAPLTSDLAAQVTTELTDQGWTKSAGDDAVVFTSPDDGGMSMAYRLTDDEITVSDTEQGLLLIEWPPRR
jgi:hypothetical protein